MKKTSWHLAAMGGIFALFFMLGYPLVPLQGDSATYYYMAHSNLIYLQTFLDHGSGMPTPEQWSVRHLIPSVMVLGKPIVHFVHTLFAAMVPFGMKYMAFCQAFLIAALLGILVLIVSQAARLESRAGREIRSVTIWQVATVVMVIFSGSIHWHNRELLPPLINMTNLALVLSACLHYQLGPSLKRAFWVGLAVSWTLAAHLSTIPFLAGILGVEVFVLLRATRQRGTQSQPNVVLTIIVALLGVLSIPVIYQSFSWGILQLVPDPDAWYFSAYYGVPMRTYWDQLQWYSHGTDWNTYIERSDDSALHRLRMFTFYPLIFDGPLTMLSIVGWFMVARLVLGQGWTAFRALLLFGPVVPIVWYVFHFRLFPKIEALAPLTVYYILLAGYAVFVLISGIQPGFNARIRLQFRIMLGVLLVMQIFHIHPYFDSDDTTNRGLIKWLNDRGENQVVGMVRPEIFESYGIHVWRVSQDLAAQDDIYLDSWGRHPVRKWNDVRVPRFVVLTQRYFAQSSERDLQFLKLWGIDLSRPVKHFQELPSHIFFTSRYLSLFSRIVSPVLPDLAQFLRQHVERLDYFIYESGVFVYDLRHEPLMK
ncbi:MAG: hypothetical protein HQL65_01785 [Magnetococcales bacterium]|nr:hypothetical protein [Magnetococcales bacterium]